MSPSETHKPARASFFKPPHTAGSKCRMYLVIGLTRLLLLVHSSSILAKVRVSFAKEGHPTFTIAISALETVTQGVAIATSHRVLSPPKGSTPRYSVPFFQMISQKTIIGQSVLERMLTLLHTHITALFMVVTLVSPEILKLKDERKNIGSDCEYPTTRPNGA